jgi:hypothetical protein
MHERDLWMATLDEAVPTSDTPSGHLLHVGDKPTLYFHDFDFLNKQVADDQLIWLGGGVGYVPGYRVLGVRSAFLGLDTGYRHLGIVRDWGGR